MVSKARIVDPGCDLYVQLSYTRTKVEQTAVSHQGMVVSERMDGWAEAGTISRMQQKSLGVVDTTDDSKCAPHSLKAKSGKKLCLE